MDKLVTICSPPKEPKEAGVAPLPPILVVNKKDTGKSEKKLEKLGGIAYTAWDRSALAALFCY